MGHINREFWLNKCARVCVRARMCVCVCVYVRIAADKRAPLCILCHCKQQQSSQLVTELLMMIGNDYHHLNRKT